MQDFFGVEGRTASTRTVSDQMEEWILVQRIEQSTKASYKACISFWNRNICDRRGTILGDLKLQTLTTTHVKFVVANAVSLRNGKPLNGKTLNNRLQVLREAMDQAKFEGLISVNPVLDPRKGHSIRASFQKVDADPFSTQEVDRIIASMRERYPEQIANFTEFWLWTGLRTAELFALRWGSIDFAGEYFGVSEALVRGVLKGTKTNGTRRVKLNSRALAVLMRQKKHTFLAGGRIFEDPRYNQPWIDERAFRRSFWGPTLKRLGIRYRRPYNCRHTYATALIMANANHKWASLQLGHSVEMFQKTYTKWIDGDQNEAEIAKLEMNLKNQISPGLAPESDLAA
jgi:integrase